MTRSAVRAALLPALLAGAPAPAAAQADVSLARLEELDVARMELPGVTVIYSAADPRLRPASLEAEARRTGAFFADAVAFFEERLGEGLKVVVAVLSPRDLGRLGSARFAMPFSVPRDRLVVVPARADTFSLYGGDGAPGGRIGDVIRLHELGHAVAAAYLYPAGFADARPPVRWFDELVASYLAHAYMRERKPELADFAEALAGDIIRQGAPHFTTLEAYERHYDSYISAPQGGGTLGWYQNVFNRRAAELYDEHGLDFFDAIRKRLPWMRYEVWTTASLLGDLDGIAPGFITWAALLAEFTPRR